MSPIKGAYTALITPFNKNEDLDEEGLRALLQRQIAAAVQGIVVAGSTGEASTLSDVETTRLIQIAREEIGKKTRFIVGTGSYDTRRTIKNTLRAQELGADIALIVTPYYNKPTQEGLYLHFKAISEACSLPILLYNVQSRTGQNLQTETLSRLIDLPTIIGIKEASGNISQINDVIELVRTRRPEFSVLSGDDALTLPLMSLGGQGVISVLSNLLPSEMVALTEALANGNMPLAQQLHFQLLPLMKTLFIETNPIPIKAAMQLCGLPSGSCRLPLCNLSPENEAKLVNIVNHYLEDEASQDAITG